MSATTEAQLLLIDMCGEEPWLALATKGAVVSRVSFGDVRASAHWLTGLQGLLREQGWTLHGLSGVAVTSGPGSFTGVRTGLAAAKGLCEATNLPLAAFSRLEALALAAGEPAQAAAVLDAGRGQFYMRLSGGTGQPPSEELAGLADLDRLLRGRLVAVAREGLMETLKSFRPTLFEIGPEHLLTLAERFWAMQEQRSSGLFETEANYVRGAADIYKSPPHLQAAPAKLA